ncbi:hypothetical protein QBC38DRAFT_470459 [Podospora fimiseda]|uniref:Protein kinase domain-containing protein n=1 Tax=Podospora fimiseda TaxID=252190 RepID=A0AAN7BUT1_9PEZI|nr:hypothetical protein QBC38DRAFT_470459 [Podospora fimiseda]
MLGNRYKVLHKLGHGGYANVWLCRDASSSCYVAVKIIMADGSHPNCPEKRVNRLLAADLSSELIQYFCLPLEEFIISGPNGIHFALVYPALGPRISNLLHLLDSDYVLDLGSTLRTMALHATKAMAILHSHSICHGGI